MAMQKLRKYQMATTTHKLFTLDELHDYQQQGKWPVADSLLLSTKYKDRWEVAKKLHDIIDVDFWKKINKMQEISEWNDEHIPSKIYSHIYSGDVFSWDDDYISGPESWKLKDNGVKSTDVVQRRKIYFYNWSDENIRNLGQPVPQELKYFAEMLEDFRPVLEHYLTENYSDQSDQWEDLILYKLMVIKYNTPSATEETLTEHREHCSLRFGREHCDETLGGLHLGENYSEFYAKNTKTNERNIITELAEDKMLWMHGEDAEQSGFIPTYHGVEHNPDPSLQERYSIIIDLQANYK